MSSDESEFQTVKFATWGTAKEWANRTLPSDKWVFRGEAHDAWSLQTTLERMSSSGRAGLEKDLLNYFRRRALVYLPGQFVPPADHTYAILWWLALMQHYGAPTRLLDWTRSFYVSCFFAMEPSYPTLVPRVVWAMRIAATDESQLIRQRRAISGAQRGSPDVVSGLGWPERLDAAVVAECYWRNAELCVIPIEPLLFDARQEAQQAVFVCAGNVEQSFLDNFKGMYPDTWRTTLVRIVLDPGMRGEVLRDLHRMNVTAATLFPGLDGFARSLRTRFL